MHVFLLLSVSIALIQPLDSYYLTLWVVNTEKSHSKAFEKSNRIARSKFTKLFFRSFACVKLIVFTANDQVVAIVSRSLACFTWKISWRLFDLLWVGCCVLWCMVNDLYWWSGDNQRQGQGRPPPQQPLYSMQPNYYQPTRNQAFCFFVFNTFIQTFRVLSLIFRSATCLCLMKTKRRCNHFEPVKLYFKVTTNFWN